MTKEELMTKLRALVEDDPDIEKNHRDADGLLIKYINDPEITEAYQAIAKWYS